MSKKTDSKYRTRQSISLSPDVAIKLRITADKTGLKISTIVEKALRQFLAVKTS